MHQLSKRGTKAVGQVLRKDFEIFFEAARDLYDEQSNPHGKVTLNVAENVLSWPLLKRKIRQVCSDNDIPEWVSQYTSSLGHPDFRGALADFFTTFLCDVEVSPSHLAASAGATPVVELTSWILCDQGDVAVIPAPSYPVYTMDIGNKSAVERNDLVTHHHTEELWSGPVLEISHLEKVYAELESKGKNFRMLVITSPDNPTGGIYPIEKLEEIADWCIARSIHLVVNEIYGLSLIPSYAGEGAPFQSFAGIMAGKNSQLLHRWYSLSKDFGASGFRVGVLHTLNESLLKAYDNLNAPHMVSNHTQWLFQHVLSDRNFVADYIQENQKRLETSCMMACSILDEIQIPYVPVQGSLFIWMDMSAFLSEQTQEAEDRLWMDIYNQTGVLLTPGDGFGHTLKGMFRLVYSCVPLQHLEEAMQRLKGYVENARHR